MDRERHLGSYLRALTNAMAQDMQQQTEQLGLTSAQGMFLHHLWIRQNLLNVPTYARDLEEFFYIKHPTVSGILQRMEAAGFVTFQAKEDDRRCKTILLTEKAISAHRQIEQHISASEERLTQGMDQTDKENFRRLLKLASANLGVCERPCFPLEQEVSKL